MGDRLNEIRALWNREDMSQPVSIGRAFEDVEWCLEEIGRLSTQLEAMTRLKESFEDQVARIAKERDEAHAERDTTLKREGRLRGALQQVDTLIRDCDPEVSSEVYRALNAAEVVTGQALADEGRE